MTNFAEAAYGVRDRVLEAKGRKAEVIPQNNLRASQFWACDRNLYYQITNWQDKVAPTAEKQALFDEGIVMEEATLADLREAGYTIGGQQVRFQMKVRNGIITGSIDGWISGHGIEEPVPLEVKGYAFGIEKYKTWRDMQAAKQPWIQSVPNQLQMYMLQANSEVAVLALRDKKSGQIHSLPVELDYDLAESLLTRAEHVYDCLEMELPPDRAAFESNLCGACDWAHICQPFAGLEVSSSGQIFNEPMEAVATEYLETLGSAGRFNVAAKELKAFAKGVAAEHGLTEIVLGEVALLKVNATEKRTVVKILSQEDANVRL